MGISLHWINATIDGRQVDQQSSVVEIAGKIHDTRISILIDPRATLGYITPDVVELNKLKIINFISDLEFSLYRQKIRDQCEHPTTRVL
jgi:hypothetical protein